MIGYRTRTVGTKLRRAREWRRISLRQVADSTKISVAVLQVLERDDISYLPGGVVGRGFVRSFATAVKIDPEAIVAQFVAQFPQHSVSDGYPAAAVNEPPVPLRSEVREVPIKIYRSKGATLLRVAAVGLLPAGFALYHALHTRKPSALWGKIQRWAVTAPASLGATPLKPRVRTLRRRIRSRLLSRRQLFCRRRSMPTQVLLRSLLWCQVAIRLPSPPRHCLLLVRPVGLQPTTHRRPPQRKTKSLQL